MSPIGNNANRPNSSSNLNALNHSENISSNEKHISNKFKRMVDRFQIYSKSNKLYHNHNRKRTTYDLLSRDRKDASGKKGFRVKIPTKFLMYIGIVFFLVPLMIAFAILIRIFFFKNGHNHVSNGGGNIHSMDLTMKNSGNLDVIKSQIDEPLNEGMTSSIRSNDGGNGVRIGNVGTEIAESGGDIISNSTVQQGHEHVMESLNDTSTSLGEQQSLEELQGVGERLENGVPNSHILPLDVDNNPLGIIENSLSSNVENGPQNDLIEQDNFVTDLSQN